MASRQRGRSRARKKRFSDHGGNKGRVVQAQPEAAVTEPVAAPEDSPTTAG